MRKRLLKDFLQDEKLMYGIDYDQEVLTQNDTSFNDYQNRCEAVKYIRNLLKQRSLLQESDIIAIQKIILTEQNNLTHNVRRSFIGHYRQEKGINIFIRGRTMPHYNKIPKKMKELVNKIQKWQSHLTKRKEKPQMTLSKRDRLLIEGAPTLDKLKLAFDNAPRKSRQKRKALKELERISILKIKTASTFDELMDILQYIPRKSKGQKMALRKCISICASITEAEKIFLASPKKSKEQEIVLKEWGEFSTEETPAIHKAIKTYKITPRKSQEQNVEKIGRFFYDFEMIYPFASGNDRTGRILALYLILYAKLTPFLFGSFDEDYRLALREGNRNKMAEYFLKKYRDRRDELKHIV